MPNDLAASRLVRFLYRVYGPNLDDAANRSTLDGLRSSLGATAHAATESPNLVKPLRLHAREHVVHAQWIETDRGGLRADVVTNLGRGAKMLGANNYRIAPRQVVAIFLPHATVPHILSPITLGVQLPYVSSHVSLAQSEYTSVQPIEPAFDVHLWRADGERFVRMQAAHGYKFAACLDGVLYADSLSPHLQPAYALAALYDLRAIADLPWQPPAAITSRT